MENEKERDIGQDQAVALSARCARLGRRVHRSAHIVCSRALSLCAVFQSLRRSHAYQVENISVSKSAHTPEHAPVRWPPQLRLLRGHASRRFFLMGVRPHGDSFGGKPNGLQSQAGQQRSHPYGKAVLAARASSPPAVQGSRVVVIFNNEWLRT